MNKPLMLVIPAALLPLISAEAEAAEESMQEVIRRRLAEELGVPYEPAKRGWPKGKKRK